MFILKGIRRNDKNAFGKTSSRADHEGARQAIPGRQSDLVSFCSDLLKWPAHLTNIRELR